MERQVNFIVNKETLELIEELKKEFGVTTNAAVLRKALALARVATKNAGPDRTFTILDKESVRHKVMLTG